MPSSRLEGFHRLTPVQRQSVLLSSGWIEPADIPLLTGHCLAGGEVLPRLSENVVGAFLSPLSIVTNLVVNGVDRLVPMTTEEPSVVAACCHAARLTRASGGVLAQAGERRIAAQVLVLSALPTCALQERVQQNLDAFLKETRRRHPRLTQAGGGVTSVHLRPMDPIEGASVVEILMDPGDAMGANVAMAVGEEFKATFSAILEATWMAPIVTNQPFGLAATAQVRIPLDHLAAGGLGGDLVAARIAMLSRWADEDPTRRVTHQKGVLNGIVAVFGTLSQDTRALSVALMTDCAQRGRPCVTWTYRNNELLGEFQGPLPCGTVGGTGPHRPVTNLFLRWMGVASVGQLAEVSASVGLLSNLAALRAIATDSLYEGHMKLHERKQRESGPST